MPDYIPAPDADFNNWETNFMAYANANLAALGLVAADMTPLVTAQTVWKTVYPAHLTAVQAARSAAQAKDNSRTSFTATIRPLVGRLQANVNVTPAQKQALGITVRDTHHTPIGPPTTAPVAVVDAHTRLRHTISFRDSVHTSSRGKPAGVHGAEIWAAVVANGSPPPAGPGAMHFVALDTRSPYLAVYDDIDGGKTAYYALRWVNPANDPGPWSETVMATIGA